ncbi:putative plant lipid transfer protein/Par allergen [Medicago truncatula]|uniref:Non-specific lipid-transfer protein n=1 Tax=Medicago truncatula TaxID=3880 RepID=G7KX40_MEDTR|nr:non-specific lipid-transfer protein [Medicago truncatula]AES79800.1 Lipid transfer protein [Medicago truncatula]RHN46663.1 putative plant lipid transfer protein/Par allergen [Medicago truncatula]
MASSMLIKVTCLSVMCLLLAIPLANADPDPKCKNVAESIIPCVEYIMTPDASNPPAPCCNGMTSLAGQVQALPERQFACRCIKDGIFDLPDLNLAALAALPNNCGVDLRFQITPDMDCDNLN